MKTKSIFSAFLIITAFGLGAASGIQAQASYVPGESARLMNSKPVVITDTAISTPLQRTRADQVSGQVHQYKVAIKEADRLIKLATTDEERDALKAKKAELEHNMIMVQQSNG